LSVGETKAEMHAMLDVVDVVLPQDKPRYLMGVGSPEDLVNGVLRGIDIFDCVLPTRLARHNAAMTRTGRLNLMNASYAREGGPIDETCTCYTCPLHTGVFAPFDCSEGDAGCDSAFGTQLAYPASTSA
jgi:queuine tRNA-ribosyltransferase